MKKFTIISLFIFGINTAFAMPPMGGVTFSTNGGHHGHNHFDGFISLAFPFSSGPAPYHESKPIEKVTIVEHKYSENKGGGFINGNKSNNNFKITYISDLKHFHDDDKVRIRGNIVEQLEHDKYLFHDSTGSIIVEIDDDIWNGQYIDSKDEVDIYGELDKSFSGKLELEAKEINLISRDAD